VGAVVGEEDEASISIEGDGPFRAAEIEAPAALEPMIIKLRARMDALASTIPPSETLAALTAFIDPIDGTREFCTGLGEQCSICVGFADGAGQAVGGLVYRPLCAQRSWALGCQREGTCRSELRTPETALRTPETAVRTPETALRAPETALHTPETAPPWAPFCAAMAARAASFRQCRQSSGTPSTH
jgi:3'-phosphoadenosine 5'-phosphosulfate (PAPS) 3'-phosphatase